MLHGSGTRISVHDTNSLSTNLGRIAAYQEAKQTHPTGSGTIVEYCAWFVGVGSADRQALFTIQMFGSIAFKLWERPNDTAYFTELQR